MKLRHYGAKEETSWKISTQLLTRWRKSSSERKQARAFLAEFDAWLERASPLPGVGERRAVGRFRDVPQREAVMEILEENAEQVFLTREIVDILVDGGMQFQTQTPVTSISSILSKAADEGKVERRGRGLWSLGDVAGSGQEVTVQPQDDNLPF